MKLFGFWAGWPAALVLWLALIGAGYAWLFRYSFAAGKTSSVPTNVPASLAASGSRRPQLFLALHPRCPCSRATVRELAKVLTLVPDRSDVTVLIYKPATESDEWFKGALLDECRRMNCRIRPDPDGLSAASLGCLTSGGIVLYDAEGRLRYQGGITASRGHEGDNLGELAVIDILRGGAGRRSFQPVFGCPIRESTSPSAL